MGLFDAISGFLKPVTKLVSPLIKPIFTTLGSSALSLGTDYARQKLIAEPAAEKAHDQSVESTALAHSMSRQAYQERYQDTVRDLYKAGLNPILALSSGFSAGNAPQMQQPQAFQPHMMGESLSGAKNLMQTQKDTAEIDRINEDRIRIKSEWQVNKQNIKESIQRILESRARTSKTHQEEIKINKEIWNLEKQFELIDKQVDKTQNEIYELSQRTSLQVVQRQHYLNSIREQDANIKRMVALRQQIVAQTSKLKSIANVYNGPYGKVLSYIDETLKSIGGPIIGAILGGGVSHALKLKKAGKFTNKFIKDTFKGGK